LPELLSFSIFSPMPSDRVQAPKTLPKVEPYISSNLLNCTNLDTVTSVLTNGAMKNKHFIPYQQGAKPAQGSTSSNANLVSSNKMPDFQISKASGK